MNSLALIQLVAPRPRRWLATLVLGSMLALGASPAAAQGTFNPSGEQSQPAAEVGETTVDWYWWWHLNKDRYLQLRKRVFEIAPLTGGTKFYTGEGKKVRVVDPSKLTPFELRIQIVPSILGTLAQEYEGASEPNGQLVVACLFALAKIGVEGELSEGDAFHEIISDYLDDDSGGVRDQAVVALGILGSVEAVPKLIEILRDSPRGQRIVDRTEVPRTMRAYAIYALGMIGARSEDMDLRREIILELALLLDGPKFATRDIKTACVNAIGLMPLEVGVWSLPVRWTGGKRPDPPNPLESRLGQIRYLLAYLKNTRTSISTIRSHVPIAIMRLMEGGDDRTRIEVLEYMLRQTRRNTPEENIVQQSIILSLGMIGDSDRDKLDRKVVDTLQRYVEKGDSQARRYALISLAQIGARPGVGEDAFYSQEEIARYLRRHMEGRGESRTRAWAAMGLGVMIREMLDAGYSPPEEEVLALRKALKDCLTPLDIGAYSVAVGLARDAGSLEILVDKLSKFELDTPRGLVLLAMGMIGNRQSVEPLLAELRDIKFRGERMAFAAIGLALAGSPDRIPVLTEMLETSGSQTSQGPIVAALGVTGDRRIIGPLSAIAADDDKYTDNVRTAAIVGLGNVADKDSLLWRARLSANVNYRFGAETFITPFSGILTFY